jgi:hypothetical protein
MIPSLMVYNHNSGKQFFCNLPAKIYDVIWWDLLVSYFTKNFNQEKSPMRQRFRISNQSISDSTEYPI